MKALVCAHYGEPESLLLEDRPLVDPSARQVRVRVHAAGVNFVDALFIAGSYQVKIPTPFVPGNELAGVVEAVGSEVTAWKPGDRVMAQAGSGAFAEFVTLHEGQLRQMPHAFDFAQAAAFQLTYATSLYALRERAGLRAGETLMVLGAAGGVGSAAVDIGKYLGARVIACAGSPEKLAACRALGADEAIDYDHEDLKERAKALTGGRGADVIYDPVGDRYSEPALRAIAWEGRFLVVGFAAGNIARIPLNLALLKGCQIVGVDWGQLARTRPAETEPVWASLIEMANAGALHPRVHAEYPLADGPRALRDVLARKVMGKAVLRMV